MHPNGLTHCLRVCSTRSGTARLVPAVFTLGASKNSSADGPLAQDTKTLALIRVKLPPVLLSEASPGNLAAFPTKAFSYNWIKVCAARLKFRELN